MTSSILNCANLHNNDRISTNCARICAKSNRNLQSILVENRSRDPPGAPQAVQRVLRDGLGRLRSAPGGPRERKSDQISSNLEPNLDQISIKFGDRDFDRRWIEICTNFGPNLIEFRAILNKICGEMRSNSGIENLIEL